MTPYEAYRKALTVKKRLPELESIILQDAEYAFRYAANIIKGRWEEGEASIAKNGAVAYYYSLNVLKKKWKNPEKSTAEKSIAEHRVYAYHYAKDILRFNIKHKYFYMLAIKNLWPHLPEELKNDPDIMTAYFKDAILI